MPEDDPDRAYQLASQLYDAQCAVRSMFMDDFAARTRIRYRRVIESLGLRMSATGSITAPKKPTKPAPVSTAESIKLTPLALAIEPEPLSNASNVKLTPFAESILKGKELSELIGRKLQKQPKNMSGTFGGGR